MLCSLVVFTESFTLQPASHVLLRFELRQQEKNDQLAPSGSLCWATTSARSPAPYYIQMHKQSACQACAWSFVKPYHWNRLVLGLPGAAFGKCIRREEVSVRMVRPPREMGLLLKTVFLLRRNENHRRSKTKEERKVYQVTPDYKSKLHKSVPSPYSDTQDPSFLSLALCVQLLLLRLLSSEQVLFSQGSVTLLLQPPFYSLWCLPPVRLSVLLMSLRRASSLPNLHA